MVRAPAYLCKNTHIRTSKLLLRGARKHTSIRTSHWRHTPVYCPCVPCLDPNSYYICAPGVLADKYQLNFISRIPRERLELLAQSTLESQVGDT